MYKLQKNNVDHRSESIITSTIKKNAESVRTGFEPMTSALTVQCSNQLSLQVNWELVIREFILTCRYLLFAGFIAHLDSSWRCRRDVAGANDPFTPYSSGTHPQMEIQRDLPNVLSNRAKNG